MHDSRLEIEPENVRTINTILIDFHGCLSNGKLNMSNDGTTEFESVHARDTQPIRELVAMGYRVIIVTQSSNKVIEAYAKKLGIEKWTIRNKAQIVLPHDAVCACVGDSTSDFPLFVRSMMSFCPRDSDKEVLNYPGIHVIDVDGGCGIMSEVLRVVTGK